MKPSETKWLYALLFLAFFDLHAQHPILPAYAYSLGASAALIGVILSGYAFTDMIGNVLAGPFIDRHGSKLFIVCSLWLAGGLLILQAFVTRPEELVWVRLLTGFAIAFLSPACFALLGKQGQGLEEQGRIMAKNGMMITLASMLSPMVGGYLADALGFNRTFAVLGIVLMIGGWLGWSRIKEKQPALPSPAPMAGTTSHKARESVWQIAINPALLPAFFAGLTMTLGQGVLMYEVPYILAKSGEGTTETGLLLTVMGLGSLCTLSQGWLHRYSPFSRCFVGLTVAAFLFYMMALNIPIPLTLLLFVKGAAHGVLFPAMTTILTASTNPGSYGKVFGVHSAVFSLGYVIGPLIAGTLRQFVSPFFFAFVLTMTMILFFIRLTAKSEVAPIAWRS